MKMTKLFSALVLFAAFHTGAAQAQNNVIELTDPPGASQGGNVTFSANWTDNGPVNNGVQFDIIYNSTDFTFVSCTVLAPYDGYVTSCMPAGDVIRFTTFRIPTNQIPSGTLFDITFTVNAGPGMYQIMAGNPSSGTQPVDFDPALITVLGPAWDSSPIAPNDPFLFGAHTAGDTNPVISTDVDNAMGEPGTTLTGDCSVSGGDASAFILAGGPTVNISVPQAGPAQELAVACDSENLAPRMAPYSSSLVCNHFGVAPGASSPVVHPLTCTINAAPAPSYASTPAPGATFDFGQNLTTDPDQDQVLTITNDGNLDGLNGACSITASAGGVFTIDDTGNYGPLAQGAMATRTVTCDTSAAGDFVGEMQCTALDPASNAGTFSYPLTCSVDSIPTYSSIPPDGATLPLLEPTQGNGAVTTDLEITNIGEALSLLEGSCVLNGADSEITISGGNTFALLEGVTGTITVACEGDVGNYSNNLACTANAPASNAGTRDYPVNCTVDQPDPAVYASAPYAYGNGVPGDLIDLNEGNPPPFDTGGPAPSTTLTISNAADPGDDYLHLMGCAYSGDTAITAAPVTVDNDLDPGQSVDVVFTCSTADPGTFTGTYTCPFNTNPTPPPPPPIEGGQQSPATYPVQCVVRERTSEVVEDPTSGTLQTADLLPNETADWDFTFEEIRDENLDATLLGCSMASGADFEITTSTAYPQTIPAGGPPITVSVQFTDPGVGDTFTDTLNCTFEHKPEACEVEEGQGEGDCQVEVDVSWPFEVNVTGRNVTVRVTKDFDDDNPVGVDVFMECNTGLPLMQSGTVHDPDSGLLEPGQFSFVEFVVVDFEPGAIDCDVYETVPVGYTQGYEADFGANGTAGAVTDDDDGCHYEDIVSSDFTCEITNTLDIVEVVVNKEWIDDNPAYQLPQWVQITLFCNEPIQYLGSSVDQPEGHLYSAQQYIDPSNPGLFGVYPHWDGSTTCFVTEAPEAGVDQDVSDCASIDLAPGQGGECTVVNTRLYAGIPTLSQYGLILMALMMLGVGMLAFRRYS